MVNLATEPVRDYSKSKQLARTRIKPTQRQMGEISQKVDRQLKQRSNGRCELQKQCNGEEAVQRAHITPRKQLNRRTTVDDLLHCCLLCHRWLDESVDGIRYKKQLREVSQ
jgi:hypothetical protein